MKRVITAVFLLCLVAAACYGSDRYVERTTSTLAQSLEQTSQSIRSGDLSAAQDSLSHIYGLWRQHYQPLSALVRHNEIDNTELLFVRAQQSLADGDMQQAALHLAELHAMLNHLPEMETPTYFNLL